MKAYKLAAGMVVLLCGSSNISYGGMIGIGAFTSGATIQNFEAAGNGNQPGPFVIGNDAYDSDNHVVRLSDRFGSVIGRSGVAVSTDAERSSATVGYMDITLGTPALRAGMYVGLQTAWTASAAFYSVQDNPLGIVFLSGGAGVNNFAGWQSQGGLIKRIRIADGTPNNLFSIIVDDLIQEVPEPSAALLASAYFIGLLLTRRGQSPMPGDG